MSAFKDFATNKAGKASYLGFQYSIKVLDLILNSQK